MSHSSTITGVRTNTNTNNNTNTDTARSLLNDMKRPIDVKGGYFDFGHPLLNHIANCFLKAAAIGAVQAVSREAYFTIVQGGETDPTGARKRFPNLKGETNRKSLEAMVKSTGKEAMQWGFAAGMYSSVTYGLREARGAHDWKNSAVAGAVTGVALALTSEDATHEHVVQSAITGAAISTAANLLTGIF